MAPKLDSVSSQQMYILTEGGIRQNAIDEYLKEKGIRKNKDVQQLYLANKGLTEMTDLGKFNFLRTVWLNANKIRRLTCFQTNFKLEELHLQNNHLVEITGALRHLTCLKVLMLQNNQLTRLDQVVKEFSKMQSLHTLNLFNNPVSQEKDYRLFVVHSVPSVELLDRREVCKSEKDLGRKIYDQDQEKIRDTVAFGRRSEGPPEIYYPGQQENMDHLVTDTKDIGNSFLRDNPPYESEEEAINTRRMKKSVMVYTSFDWSCVPRLEERRQSNKPFDSPQLNTHVFR